MGQSKKNVAAIIIFVCIISVVVGIFLPKDKSRESTIIRSKYNKDLHFHNSPISIYKPFKGEKILAIKLEGVISDSSNGFIKDVTSSNVVLDLIVKATKDPSVKGILIKVNSPGGTVAASQELYQAISKARKKKPVVITMGDVAASGGYYIASAADAIFANPGTLTGSIGVITQYLNFYDLLTMIGVKGITIKAGEFKDIGNPTKPLSEAERKILQELLNDTYKQFLKDVAKGRNIPLEKLTVVAKGLIYTGVQAKKVGLIDYVGDYYKALQYTQKLVKERFPELARRYGKGDIPVEESWKETSIFDVLLGAITNITPKAIDCKLLKTYSYSKYQPLWLLE